ncbi:ATP-binding protein [Sphingomonas sp. ABOLH]|uniref:ATP-binding protein n=1 Tax=Sphingomonas sp. ABOLH TaxID=1985881 RepID=UPI000F7E6149|nr:ATP-binding protein [Sphingomonas sp. ABOLH]RSV31821.1 PAS domain S-box protein [Sphingomonas sp. ABOLH]
MTGESGPSDAITPRPHAGAVPAVRPLHALRMVPRILGYGLLIYFLAVVMLCGGQWFGGTELMWVANPIAVAILIRYSRRHWPLLLAVTGVALVTANACHYSDTASIMGYGAIDLIGITAVASAIRVAHPDPRLLRGYVTIVLIALAGAVLVTALFVHFRLLLSGAVETRDVIRWFAANAMGLIVLLPALKATRQGLSEEIGILSLPIVLVMAVTIGLAGLLFTVNTYPVLFLLLPCGVFAALLYRFAGAAASTIAISSIAIVCTLQGVGPIARLLVPAPDRILYLQLFIAAFTLTAFPVAALVYEQWLALTEIRENERHLRLLADHSTDLIIRLGPDGLRRYASSGSQQLLGYPPDQLLGQSPFQLIHPDDRDRVQRALEGLKPAGPSVVVRYRMLHRDGHYLWLEGAFRMVGDDPARAEVIGSIRDIAERRAAEGGAVTSFDELEEQQRLLAMAESAAGIGHWRLNLADWRLFWSPEVFRIHGLDGPPEPGIASAIHHYHPDDRVKVRSRIGMAIGQGGSFEFDARIVRADGEIRWVRSRGQAETAPGAGIVGLFGVFQDITEHVAAITDLRAAREEAERALAAKETFTATISHEIRTPLTSILAAVQLLRDTPDRTERMRHLDSLETAGRSLSAIVDDVLTFSKLEGGHGSPEAIAFEPRQLLQTVAELFAAEARRHALSIELDAAPGRVIGDPARLQRVLTNLVGNAVKFTRTGTIAISATREGGDRWRFQVTDTGVGIRGDRLDAIFEPFVQADASTTRSYGGTGLGLSISRMLVESMQGAIQVASAPGAGSRFWFDIPLPPATATTDDADRASIDGGASSVPAATNAMTVLVVEDNDINRYLLAEIVRRLGHHVVSVENGARAVEYVTAPVGNPVDLVLMDVQMPVMDGLAATRAMRAWGGAGATVPIHAITADLSTERRADIAQAGMNGVLTKPVDMAQLSTLLNHRAAAPGRPSAGTPDARPIDPQRIRALTDVLGAEQRNTLLSLLIEDARRVPDRLRTLLAHGRNNLARREAHAFQGAAASMGAAPLIAALAEIEKIDDDATVDPRLMERIDDCARDVINAARAAMEEAA